MKTAEEIIQQIEQDLQIRFNESPLSHAYEAENGVITEIRINDFHFEHLEVLRPLFPTVKKLEIYWGCSFNENILKEELQKFTALEILYVEVASLKAANQILSINRLQGLQIWLRLENEIHSSATYTLNLAPQTGLRNLWLCFSGETSQNTFVLKGMAHLLQLESLLLECVCQIKVDGISTLPNLRKLTLFEVDANCIPELPGVKTLRCSPGETDEINIAGKFPNLENLKIEGFTNISLGTLPHLKILVMGAPDFDLENTLCFDQIPNLEELGFTGSDISKIQKIGNLKRLKRLDLSENEKLENIDDLAELDALEYLNLFDNNISDIRVLNQLPNLKQVNLARNNIQPHQVAEQLDHPEIACFMSYPQVPFVIGGHRIF